MTGAMPWNRNEGRFDRPSSSVPLSRLQTQALAAKAPDAYLDRRARDAAHAGVVATGVDSILQRIDAAIEKLQGDGLGSPKVIYLVETDLLAFRAAVKLTDGRVHEWRDIPVRTGLYSKVYGLRGARAVRRPRKGQTA